MTEIFEPILCDRPRCRRVFPRPPDPFPTPPLCPGCAASASVAVLTERSRPRHYYPYTNAGGPKEKEIYDDD